jgi:hypothetical protein
MHACWTGEVHAGYWWGVLKEGDHVRDLGIDGRIILKLMFKKWELEDLRNVGEGSCNPGDGTDQRAQSLLFIMMKKWDGEDWTQLSW